MSGYVVVDASVAVKWLVREEHTERALAILSAWHDDEITPAAPYLLPFEVANALHRRVIRDQLSVGDTARMISQLLSSRLAVASDGRATRQSPCVGNRTSTGGGLRRPLLSSGRSAQLRAVDRRREIPPRGTPGCPERPLDRRARSPGLATGNPAGWPSLCQQGERKLQLARSLQAKFAQRGAGRRMRRPYGRADSFNGTEFRLPAE